jgi:putative hydrolase of the HAD superfamily
MDAIFFDLGGVIVDFDHRTIAHGLLGAEAGARALSSEEVHRWLFDRTTGLNSAFNAGRISPAEFHEAICRKFGLTLPFEPFVQIWSNIFSENQQVSRMIHELAGSFPLFLISNTDPLHFEYIVRRYAVLQKFEAWILSYEVGACKPDEKIFVAASERAGVPPDRSVFIDDIPAYVEAAQSLGFHAIHYTSARTLKNALSTFLPFEFHV